MDFRGASKKCREHCNLDSYKLIFQIGVFHPLPKDSIAHTLAKLFVQHIYQLHGDSDRII